MSSTYTLNNDVIMEAVSNHEKAVIAEVNLAINNANKNHRRAVQEVAETERTHLKEDEE